MRSVFSKVTPQAVHAPHTVTDWLDTPEGRTEEDSGEWDWEDPGLRFGDNA